MARKDDVEEKAKHLMDMRSLVFTSIISALGFVVGLFWNDAIRSAIEEILPSGEGLFYKFVAAVLVTGIVVIIIVIMVRSQKGIKDLTDELEKKRLEAKQRFEQGRKKRRKGFRGLF